MLLWMFTTCHYSLLWCVLASSLLLYSQHSFRYCLQMFRDCKSFFEALYVCDKGWVMIMMKISNIYIILMSLMSCHNNLVCFLTKFTLWFSRVTRECLITSMILICLHYLIICNWKLRWVFWWIITLLQSDILSLYILKHAIMSYPTTWSFCRKCAQINQGKGFDGGMNFSWF